MRMARSRPSSTRFTCAALDVMSMESSAKRLRKAGTAGATCIQAKLSGAETRRQRYRRVDPFPIVLKSRQSVHQIRANPRSGKGLSPGKPHRPGRSTMNVRSAAVEPFIRAPAEGSTLDVLGVTHLYKATGAET